MSRDIRKIEPLAQKIPAKKRVAAYARVSSGKEAMLHSLSAQVSYYSGYVQKHRGWQYIGVYADEAITGTKNARPEFQRMISDCKAGKINMILTKSISRFARNTVTLLEIVRELTVLGVDVFFEKENIHTISGDGELMLTILASFAQEESLSVSENCKWRIRDNFKKGIVPSITILGYRRNIDGVLKIEPAEADIIRMIFTDYISGMSKQAISNKLNTMNIPTRLGFEWQPNAIGYILSNEKYVGDMLLQKFFRLNHISKRKCPNKGELPMYFVQDCHEPIIDRSTFEQVQVEIQRRTEHLKPRTDNRTTYPFTGKIVCGKCGKNYRRKIAASGTKYEKPVWICPTFHTNGKAYCDSKQIPQNILMTVCAEVLGLSEFDEQVFADQIQQIIVSEANELIFMFHNGATIEKSWQDHSRRDSWDDTKRELARQKALDRRKK